MLEILTNINSFTAIVAKSGLLSKTAIFNKRQQTPICLTYFKGKQVASTSEMSCLYTELIKSKVQLKYVSCTGTS